MYQKYSSKYIKSSFPTLSIPYFYLSLKNEERNNITENIIKNLESPRAIINTNMHKIKNEIIPIFYSLLNS